MGETEVVPIETLVLDWTLYPRHEVDSAQVTRLLEAIHSGEVLPPLDVCRESNRIVDGFHRYHAYKRAKVGEVPVVRRAYASEQEILLASIRANARHGVPLGPMDRARVIELADGVGLSREALADALAVRTPLLERVQRTQMGRAGRKRIYLKPALRHYAGQQVPAEVRAANEILAGNSGAHLLRQVIALVRSGGLDASDEQIRGLLDDLRAALDEAAVAA